MTKNKATVLEDDEKLQVRDLEEIEEEFIKAIKMMFHELSLLL